MKKIMILAVVTALIGFSLPQSASAQQSTTPQDNEQNVHETQLPQETGTSGTGTGTASPSSNKYVTEVKVSELPSAVSRAISERYPGYKTEKAFKSSDNTYKVTLMKDDEKQTIFLDEKGESVKMIK
jgi:hypothetical protein